MVGTIAYMAPEQACGEAVDHRADIWSVGLVLYEMAKGTRPAPAVQLRVEESPELERVISKCLETDRALRYQHAADLRTDLERLRSGQGATVAPHAALGRRRARWLSIGAAAVVVTAAVAGVIYSRRAAPLTPAEGHDSSRGIRQHHRRRGVRRHDAARTRGTAPAIAIPQPYFRRTYPKNAAIDRTSPRTRD